MVDALQDLSNVDGMDEVVPNFAGSGRPGWLNTPFTWYLQSPTSTDAFQMQFLRIANYSGGSGGEGGWVNLNTRTDTIIGNSARANECNVLNYLESEAPGTGSPIPQNTAGYDQVIKKIISGGSSPLIGRTIECIDQETNPIWGSCSLEIDQSVAGNNNTDNNNNRLGVLLVFRPSGSYTGTEVSYGIKSSIYSGTYLKSLLYIDNYGGTIGKYIDFPNFMVDSVGKLQSTYVLMNRPSVSSPSSYAYEYQINGVRFFSLYADNSGRTVFKSTGTLAFRLAPATISLEPETDAGGNIGSASFRLNVVYAATGAINTSDATTKTPLTGFDNDVLDAIGEVRCGLYQWLDAVTTKGRDRARFHAGALAQQIAEIFAERDLDVSRYGFWCSDPLFEDVEEEIEADDIPVMETYTETEEQITFENGRAVRRMVKIAKERQAIDLLPLFDDQGQPLMNLGRPAITRPRIPSDPEDMPIQEETGHVIVEPAIPSEQRVVSMPRVEKGIRKTTVQRPVLDSEGKHVQRLGLRYDELLILLNAWSRRELARLNDRLIRLEGALAGQN